MPVFVASLRAAPAFLGLVEGLADATSSLLKLASGYVADRSRAKKPLVLFGYGMAALVRPLVALATAPWHVLAVRVTDRVGKGIRSAPRDVLIANSVSKQESGRAFVVSGWIVYAVTYLAFGVASQSWHAWALSIVYGIYYGLTEPAEKALVKDLTPTALRGRAYGFYNFIIGVSAVPAGLLTGWLWQTWTPRVALTMGASIAASSSVALVVWAASGSRGQAANE